jgi:hypothetical protein
MLSLRAFFLALGDDIRVESLKRLWDVGGAGEGVESEDAEVRIADGNGAKDIDIDTSL